MCRVPVLLYDVMCKPHIPIFLYIWLFFCLFWNTIQLVILDLVWFEYVIKEIENNIENRFTPTTELRLGNLKSF